MRRNLAAAGLAYRVMDGAVQVERNRAVDKAWSYVQELLECRDMILAAADPDKVRPYKGEDADLLLIAALDAVKDATGERDLVARLLHGFVWSQGLPNVNHRSATTLAEKRLFRPGASVPSVEEREASKASFWEVSKHLIREKEFTPNFGASIKPNHLAAAKELVRCLTSPASSRSP